MATACECVRKRLKYRERKCVHVSWYVLDSPSKRAQDCIHLCLPYLIMNQKAFSLQLSFGTWQCGSLVYTFRTLLCGMSLMCYMYTLPLICAYLSLSLSRSIPRVVVHLKSKMQSPPIFIYIRLFRSIATTDLSPVTEKHTPPDSKHF